MDVSEIFAKLKSHILEGLVFHDEMVRYYGFIHCDNFKREHEERYWDESEGYRKLCDYYMNHYNSLIPTEPMERPDVIPDSWYRYTRQEVDSQTRNTAIRVGAEKWVKWEKQTKNLYQQMWSELTGIGEIAAACFLECYIRDVDCELKHAEKSHMEVETK